jgi:hypothetical protein
VRRLLQVGTFLFLLTVFVTPLSECFDQWDAPGLANDVEFGVFALALTLALILVLCLLLSARSLLRNIAAGAVVQPAPSSPVAGVPESSGTIFIPPRIVPLRI